MKFLSIFLLVVLLPTSLHAQAPFTHTLNFESSVVQYNWRAGHWGNCLRPCGTGIIQKRSVDCMDLEGNLVDISKCSAQPKPKDWRSCPDQPSCTWERACNSNDGNGTCGYTTPLCMTGAPNVVSNHFCDDPLSGAGLNPGVTGVCDASCPDACPTLDQLPSNTRICARREETEWCRGNVPGTPDFITRKYIRHWYPPYPNAHWTEYLLSDWELDEVIDPTGNGHTECVTSP